MPTSRFSLLYVYCHTFKSQHGPQRRGFSILKGFGVDTDTRRIIEAYEKRHQNFIKVLRRGLTSKAKENVISRETTEVGIAKRQAKSTTNSIREKSPAQPKMSLFEELFPDEVKGAMAEDPSASAGKKMRELPQLVLREIDQNPDNFEDGYVKPRQSRHRTTETASRNAIEHWNPAILVLEVASPSLTEDDFRRIAPKGEHISCWVGPGDIFIGGSDRDGYKDRYLGTKFLTVIPARDPTTLRQKTLYFLVFPNPAYARAYQNRVCRLHKLAQTHAPASLESPIAPPKGGAVQDEEIHGLLQDYTIIPPSQTMHLVALFPPFSASVQRLLDRRGYPELTTPIIKAGRCVLFWVEGYVPTITQVRELIKRDSIARGLAWALLEGKDSIQQLDNDANFDSEASAEDRMPTERQLAYSEPKEQAFFDYLPRTLRRWTIAFQDENEARRFVRRWHMRPFSEMFTKREHKGDVKPLVHAEFMW